MEAALLQVIVQKCNEADKKCKDCKLSGSEFCKDVRKLYNVKKPGDIQIIR